MYNGLTYSTRALVDVACGGSITSKTTKETNQLFEELEKNNYQAPFERSIGRRQGGILELDQVLFLEEKFEALMIKLNQKIPREPRLGEIAYMKTQEAMLANATSQVEKVNYLNIRGYVFQPNNNFPTHYHLGLRNHENLSSDNEEIMPHVPHQISVSNAEGIGISV